MAPKSTFELSESPFWPKLPLSCFSFGAQRVMVGNGSFRDGATGGLRGAGASKNSFSSDRLNAILQVYIFFDVSCPSFQAM